MTDASVKSLQAVGKTLAGATTPDDIDTASAHLAQAIGGETPDRWKYGLATALRQTRYALVNELAPAEPEKPPPIMTTAAPSEPPVDAQHHKNDAPIQLAAAGDLACDGFAGGCSNGGSWGSTAGYRIFGRNLCRDCSVKILGLDGESNDAITNYLRKHELE